MQNDSKIPRSVSYLELQTVVNMSMGTGESHDIACCWIIE